jgi:nitrite reductase (NADH) small subunit
VSATRTLTRHHVGAVGDFAMEKFRVFDLGGRPVGVVRTTRGFFAVRNRCPHQGAEICAGKVSGTMVASRPYEYAYTDQTMVVACPWHRWEFELDTGYAYGRVTNKRLVTYEVEIENDQVYVVMGGRRP